MTVVRQPYKSAIFPSAATCQCNGTTVNLGKVVGNDGAQGAQGEKGEKGDKGDQGVQGEKGDAGINGSMCTGADDKIRYERNETDHGTTR